MIYIAFEKCENSPSEQSNAGIIARDKLLEIFALNKDLCIKTENGKPYYSDGNFFFSISHSEDIAVCALRTSEERYDLPDDILTIFEFNTGELGIDIEKSKENSELSRLNRIAKRFFKREFNNTCDFLIEWTKKEALAKKEDIPLINALKRESDFISFSVEINERKYIMSLSI